MTVVKNLIVASRELTKMKYMYPSKAHKFQDPRSTCNAAVSDVQRKTEIEGNTITR